MIKGIRIALCGLLLAVTSSEVLAQKFELLEYGKMDNWVVRNIKESAVIGGKKKTIYAIGREHEIEVPAREAGEKKKAE